MKPDEKLMIVTGFSLHTIKPGGMRGAIEYGQPLAGLSRVEEVDEKVPSGGSLPEA